MKIKLKKRTRIRLAWEAFINTPAVALLVLVLLLFLSGMAL